MRNKGITLVALVITIIVLLILSGVTISALSGENGIITNAVKAKKMTTLSQCKEEYEMFITEEMIKNNKFQKTSLVAGENNLYFNTQKSGEVGNIFNVIPSLKNNEYSKKLEIIKGDLLLNTKDPKEIELAESIGIKPNPYDIVNGELQSSNGNLLLMDETGTLTIPDRVTSIGEGAFANVSGLKTIIIPGTVKVIGVNAFANNPTLEKVIIEDGVEKIGSNAFAYCNNLLEINMPDTINQLGTQQLYRCYNLIKIKIPQYIKTIPSYFCSGCEKLERIELPNSVNSIDSYAFASCIMLNNLTIPETVEKINPNAFNNCKNLDNIILNNNKNILYENGILMPQNKSEILFISDKKLTSSNILEIPEGIKSFSSNIENYENIDTFKIPNSLEYVEFRTLPTSISNIIIKNDNMNFTLKNNVLYSKDELEILACFDKGETIELSNISKTIKQYSFKFATNLTTITIPENILSIEAHTFNSCNKLKTMYVGKNVSRIDSLFKHNKNRLDLIIDPENPYYTVDNYVLYSKDKSNLVSVLYEPEGIFTIDKNVKTIEIYAFHAKNKITEVIIPEGVEEINSSFQWCAFSKITIPSTIKKISEAAFIENKNLVQITINKPKDSIAGAPWGATRGNRIIEWKR